MGQFTADPGARQLRRLGRHRCRPAALRGRCEGHAGPGRQASPGTLIAAPPLLSSGPGARGAVAAPFWESARNQPRFSTGVRAVDTAGVAHTLENLDPESHPSVQFLPPVGGNEDGAGHVAGPEPDDPVARLRDDLRKLSEEVAAIDRRDAAQHGGLKGEIAHLVRRIARLEAVPRPRPVR